MKNPKELDNYIVQLVQDMRSSALNLPNPGEISEFDSESLPEELQMFKDVEMYIHGTAKPIGQITGIDKDSFPELKKLNDAQAAFLLGEMMMLLMAYNFYPDFPEKLPEHIKYRILRENWNEEMIYTGSGQSHMEFCTYIPENCPFPENYCQCRDFQ